MTVKKSTPAPLLTLLGISLLANLPYLGPHFMPSGDTKSVYTFFHYFYNHYFFHGELPRWMAYGLYGTDSTLCQLAFLSPFHYLACVVGRAFSCRDSLLLFQWSLLAEQLLWALGLYLLSRRCFKHVLTVFLVTLTGICTVVHYYQVHYDFHTFSALPWIFLSLRRFYLERRSVFFWSVPLLFFFFGTGNLLYYLPLLAFLVLLANLPLWHRYRPPWRTLLPDDPASRLACLLSLLLLAGWVLLAASSREGITFPEPGRDSGTGASSLESFLTYYAGPKDQMLSPNTLEFFDRYLKGARRLENITGYVGLGTLFFFLLALLKARTAWARAHILVFLFLAGLSCGGTLAWLVYHLPAVNLYRHLGFLLSPARVFLLLGAGYGLDRFLSCWRHRAGKGIPGTAALACALLLLWWLFDFSAGNDVRALVLEDDWANHKRYYHHYYLATTVLRLAGYAGLLLFVARRWARSSVGRVPTGDASRLAFFLLLALGGDMLLYQVEVWHRRPRGLPRGSLPLAYPTYPPSRPAQMDPLTRERHEILMASQSTSYYQYYANALQYDACAPFGCTQSYSEGVARLLECRGGLLHVWPLLGRFPWQDEALLKVLGCRAPKLRLLPRALLVSDREESARLVAATPALDQVAVIEAPGLPSSPPAAQVPAAAARISVTFFSANRLECEIDNPYLAPAWLVYADSWHLSWRALLDGRPAPIFRAYLAFKAVRVAPGRHRLAFLYHRGRVEYFLAGYFWLLALGSPVFLLAALARAVGPGPQPVPVPRWCRSF